MSRRLPQMFTFSCLVLIGMNVGCSPNGDAISTESNAGTADQGSVAIQNAVPPKAPRTKLNGIEFNGTGVIRTQATHDAGEPILIEAVVVANSSKGEQAIISNCQSSGFCLSIKDGQWMFFWHDGVKYKSISAPAVLGKQTHLLGIVENSRMELRIDGVSQGMTSADGHRKSKLPFYVAADPKLDSQYNYDPAAFEYPFTGIIYECRISSDLKDITQAKLDRKQAKSDRAILHYVFDAGGETVTDKSIHKNDATIENGKWQMR